jgi:hypothetical protein
MSTSPTCYACTLLSQTRLWRLRHGSIIITGRPTVNRRLTSWNRDVFEKTSARSAGQEMNSILWSPKVHYRVHNILLSEPILLLLNKVHTCHTSLWSTYIRLSSGLLLSSLQTQIFVSIYHFPHVRYISLPVHYPWDHNHHNTEYYLSGCNVATCNRCKNLRSNLLILVNSTIYEIHDYVFSSSTSSSYYFYLRPQIFLSILFSVTPNQWFFLLDK